MKGYKIIDQESPVLAMSKLNITGNVIPLAWQEHIKHRKGDVYGTTGKGKYKADLKYDKNKTYSIAILLLSEIVYWYRPVEVRDEQSGRFVYYRKKFKADKLQRSYNSFSEQWGFSKRQVKNALKFLQDKVGVIELEFRSTNTDSGMPLSNVLFIDLNVPVLERISSHVTKFSDTPPPKFSETYTETTNTETINTPAKKQKTAGSLSSDTGMTEEDIDFWQKKNAEKKETTVRENGTVEKQPLPIDWQVAAGGKVTKENQMATRGDGINARLVGWFAVPKVTETDVAILRQLHSSFDMMPPKASEGKKQTSIWYGWHTGVRNIQDAADGKNLLEIIKQLGYEIDIDAKRKFYTAPNSLVNRVYGATTLEPVESVPCIMDENGMIRGV